MLPIPLRSWPGSSGLSPTPARYLVLLTGEGLSRLHGLATRAGIGPDFVASLGRTTTIIRGPKPARALRALGLAPQLRAEQATTEGVIALLSGLDLRGRRVGVQLYPEAPSRLADFLDAAGALPDPVIPYQYAAAASDEALAGLIEKNRCRRDRRGRLYQRFAGQAPVRTRPRSAAKRTGCLAAMRRTAIAAVGPVVASELEHHGVTPTIVPAGQYFMKPLVTAITAALAG